MDNEKPETTPDLANIAERFIELYSGQYPLKTKKLSQKKIKAAAQRYLDLFVETTGA
ncbi:MAG: hypothetical protein HOO93_04915 [Methyloglobulus sp.]|nr:hypothetical protein [Methyloglobulus sp.]